MKLVLDNNIFFTLMKPSSVNSYLFSVLKAKFIAPEFMKLEFTKHKEECLVKSKLSRHEFLIREEEVKLKIEFVVLSKYLKWLKPSIDSLQDPKDSPYLALALSTDSIIWSNDTHLKQQSLIKVLTTSELVELLIKSKL